VLPIRVVLLQGKLRVERKGTAMSLLALKADLVSRARTHDLPGLESGRDGHTDDEDDGHRPVHGRVVESVKLRIASSRNQFPHSKLDEKEFETQRDVPRRA
jgi:hypothetical protein